METGSERTVREWPGEHVNVGGTFWSGRYW